MNYPKISIVTPSYNQGQYLEDTILSVLGQRYPNLEYLIYDAASTDNSVEIIKKYEKELTYWVSEKDKGQADAINKGFNRATGEILMWLNSDDVLMPNILNFIATQYNEKGDGIYFGNCLHFEEKNNGILVARGSNVAASFNSIPLELADTIIQPSSFWSRKVWFETGILNIDLNFGFDWEWFLRAKQNNISFYPLHKSISLYRIHEEHKSGVGGRKRQEELLKIYKLYNNRYANLYEYIINENFSFSLGERVVFRVLKLIYGKQLTRTHFLRKIKSKKYKEYTAREIDIIKSML
ncbi:glycosyltransferase family 2 protein [Flavobacterium nitrogenifigens]|uniref:Glycosyltransferase involved in cell wall bisynthesis n=1 Tax=Flavobacterium nitrogenifigens TaxID=1617283 RepID=A0A521EDV3_9FLAO|nr:glycosyltransferase family 2 protein [Flavobacterium nitrogenifigens]KAF2325940.1 glycosyltransferase [Flavobacterium nitrogenifigens]SMO82088.1 Glycosyltransferase involved in cell wall bisynthesis [Flavobacterium nitrogenifigens]